MKKIVEALLTERIGYVRRGLKDRVSQVDAILNKFNVKVDADIDIEVAAVKPEVEQAAVAKKVKRTTR